MLSTSFSYRVRYADTDQMGYFYYGNYARLFEIGRVEFFRNFGISYKELEDRGVMMPVLNMQVTYKKPLLYDELVRIETQIKEIPKGLRIAFEYHIYNEKNELACFGQTQLTFVDMETRKPCGIPQEILFALEENWK